MLVPDRATQSIGTGLGTTKIETAARPGIDKRPSRKPKMHFRYLAFYPPVVDLLN